MSKVYKHMSFIFKRSGSAAIILSLIVSGSVLSTIFISQKSADWFLSSQSKDVENWEYDFVAQTALAIGGYLVSNNLILCKKAGWEHYDALCKWNDIQNVDSMSLDKFQLRNPEVFVRGVSGERKRLRFEGTIKEEIIDNPVSNAGNIKYRIIFDLVDWKETSIQNLIGEIPPSVCRDKNTMGIQEGNCPFPEKSESCKDGSNNDIPDSVCEYISDNDQDHTIVLISVEVPLDVPVRTVYAGVRRPLSMPKVEVIPPGPVCRLSCASGAAGASLPECRGDFIPPTGGNLSDMKIRITNPGPGAIYSLSLLRKDTLHKDSSETYKFKGELLEQVEKEVLLPGEHIIVQDSVDCQDSVSYVFGKKTEKGIKKTKLTVKVEDLNVHGQPFMSVAYGLFSMREPIGVCMVVDETIEEGDKPCPKEYVPGQPCGEGEVGQCYYSHIEPKRYITNDGGSRGIDRKEMNYNIVTKIPPH